MLRCVFYESPGALRGAWSRRIGLDVAPWPHRPEARANDWALAEVLRSRDINCAIDVGGNRGHFAQAAAVAWLRGADCLVRAVAERAAGHQRRRGARPRLDRPAVVRPVEPAGAGGHCGCTRARNSTRCTTHCPGVVDQIPIMEAIGTATITLSTLEAEIPAAIAGIGATAGADQVRHAGS